MRHIGAFIAPIKLFVAWLAAHLLSWVTVFVSIPTVEFLLAKEYWSTAGHIVFIISFIIYFAMTIVFLFDLKRKRS